jgi:transposase
MERLPRPPESFFEGTPPHVRAYIDQLHDFIDRRFAELEAEIAMLKAKLARYEGKDSTNSSLPPSAGHPHAKPQRPRPKSKRKRGGQPGHAKHERPLLPLERCDEVVRCVPAECRRCGEALAGADPEPLRHQFLELPKIEPIVIEHRRHRLVCRCGVSTCGALPVGVPESTAGPNLVAFVALLMGNFRQSKRRVTLFLEQFLGVPCSPGWVVKLQNQAAAALQPAYDELAAALPDQPRLNIDESPTKEGETKAWLWGFVAPTFTFFAVRPTRAATTLDELLTARFAGVVTCDRAKMYFRLTLLQWCWAHLKRDFQALIDFGDGVAKRLGHDLMRPAKELFALWSRIRDGTLTRLGLKRKTAKLRGQVEALLLRGVFSQRRALIGMCRELWKHRRNLWTFLDHDGVEPTNNAAEQALRHPVIWRKLSFGTQSAKGSRFVETLLTVVETCRRQSRNAFDYVAGAVAARFRQEPTPSLLGRA